MGYGYSGEKHGLVKHQQVDNSLVVPVFIFVVDVNCILNVTYKTIYDVRRDYMRYVLWCSS